MQKKVAMFSLALIGFIASGCGATVSSYVKPDAPWGVIKRAAVAPFTIPSENPAERELVTKLFCEELRNAGRYEVVEIPLSSPIGSGVWDVKQIAKDYKADAVITGSVDDVHGTVLHMQVHDVATEEVLWSGTYMLGMRAEFFSFKTQQQQFKRGFRWLVRKFISDSGSS